MKWLAGSIDPPQVRGQLAKRYHSTGGQTRQTATGSPFPAVSGTRGL